MATILFAWELGGGLGHMLQLQPLAEGLARRGHRVFVALRNAAGAGSVFGRSGVQFLPAPYRIGGRISFRQTLNFTQILVNVGWGDDSELFGLACAWRNLFRLARPDLIVFDHSPTALLASRGIPGVRRALIGLGFFCPPDVTPFPPFRPPTDQELRELIEGDARILARVNWLLKLWKRPTLERLGRLFHDADENFLTTFAELDHYGARQGVRYWGPVNGPGGGIAPAWPEGSAGSKRVYAYLKRCPLLPTLLEALNRRRHPTIVFADGIDSGIRKRFASATLRFEDQRLDLAQVGAACDVAIHNANHGTLTELLKAGRPMLQIPITLEQLMLGRLVCRLGVAKSVPARLPNVGAEELGGWLDALLDEQRYRTSARAVAQRFGAMAATEQRQEIIERLDSLAVARTSLFCRYSNQKLNTFRSGSKARKNARLW